MAQKKSKTKSKRDKKPYPGLNKNAFSKIKQEYHDIDYIDQLNDAEKEWLNTFMEEDLGARFNHGKKRVYKKSKDINQSYRRNNQRNRDIYSNFKASNRLIYGDVTAALETLQQEHDCLDRTEDELIDQLDKLNNGGKKSND